MAGESDVAVAAIIAAAHDLGLLPDAMRSGLADEAQPPVLGGGVPVGELTRS
jgi:hypothetical protein